MGSKVPKNIIYYLLLGDILVVAKKKNVFIYWIFEISHLYVLFFFSDLDSRIVHMLNMGFFISWSS